MEEIIPKIEKQDDSILNQLGNLVEKNEEDVDVEEVVKLPDNFRKMVAVVRSNELHANLFNTITLEGNSVEKHVFNVNSKGFQLFFVQTNQIEINFSFTDFSIVDSQENYHILKRANNETNINQTPLLIIHAIIPPSLNIQISCEISESHLTFDLPHLDSLLYFLFSSKLQTNPTPAITPAKPNTLFTINLDVKLPSVTFNIKNETTPFLEGKASGIKLQLHFPEKTSSTFFSVKASINQAFINNLTQSGTYHRTVFETTDQPIHFTMTSYEKEKWTELQHSTHLLISIENTKIIFLHLFIMQFHSWLTHLLDIIDGYTEKQQIESEFYKRSKIELQSHNLNLIVPICSYSTETIKFLIQSISLDTISLIEDLMDNYLVEITSITYQNENSKILIPKLYGQILLPDIRNKDLKIFKWKIMIDSPDDSELIFSITRNDYLKVLGIIFLNLGENAYQELIKYTSPISEENIQHSRNIGFKSKSSS